MFVMDGAESLQSPTSLRLNEQAQRTLEEMIRVAHNEETYANGCSGPTAASSLRGGASNTNGDGVVAGVRGGVDDLPAVVRLEELISREALLSIPGSTPRLPLPLPRAGIHKAEGGSQGAATASTGPEDARDAPRLGLLGSRAVCLHHDAVTSLKWADGGRSLCSTSDDGSFRVSTLLMGPQDEGKRDEKASFQSKRHFSPSDIALSSCALMGGEASEGGLEVKGEGGPAASPHTLAALGSYDNHVYLYSIPSARQLLRLDAHDDAVSCLDVAGPYLASGSWDATVKVWGIQPSRS